MQSRAMLYWQWMILLLVQIIYSVDAWRRIPTSSRGGGDDCRVYPQQSQQCSPTNEDPVVPAPHPEEVFQDFPAWSSEDMPLLLDHVLFANRPLNYSIFHGHSVLRNLPEFWKSRRRMVEKNDVAIPSNNTTKAQWALELIVNGHLDAAHEVILGCTCWDELDQAEYAATHRGQTNWSQTHPLSEVDDVVHSIIHRLEGLAIGEGGYSGYQNAKYWLAGGPKKSTVLQSGIVYDALVEYVLSRYPDLFHTLIPDSDMQYEIIADGGSLRNITVLANSWNGMALIDLWGHASSSNVPGDDSGRLLQQTLRNLFRAELYLWLRYLAASQRDSKEELLKWLEEKARIG